MPTASRDPARPTLIGQRLRAYRIDRSLSVRELARRAGCSASLVSQVERGTVTPSAQTVYALANVLDVSLDALFGDRTTDLVRPARDQTPSVSGETWGRARGPGLEGIVRRQPERDRIELLGGLRWERLTPQHDEKVDFLEVVYEPGAGSSTDAQPVRHAGREYIFVLEGQLTAHVGDAVLTLDTGDSLVFDPQVGHRYVNDTAALTRHVTLVVHHA